MAWSKRRKWTLPDKPNSFLLSLPNEIIYAIFEYLNPLYDRSRVCVLCWHLKLCFENVREFRTSASIVKENFYDASKKDDKTFDAEILE